MRTELVAKAYVDWGKWQATCPVQDCLGSGHLGRDPLTGLLGRMTPENLTCWFCGAVSRVEFPPNRASIEAVLLQRPWPHTRNWALHETVEDLLFENAEHGLTMPELEAGIHTEDGHITSGLALPSAERLEIC